MEIPGKSLFKMPFVRKIPDVNKTDSVEPVQFPFFICFHLSFQS